MKPYILSGILIAALFDASVSTGQQWEIVDEYREYPGAFRLGASAGDIGTDSTGEILFSVGSAMVPGPLHYGVVRVSEDSGTTWRTLDEHLEPGGTWTHYRGFGSTAGQIFVCGWAGSPGTYWLVRALDLEHPEPAWQTVDFGVSGSAGDIKVAPWGNVFACGTQGSRWAVRMSSDGGAPGTWGNVQLLGSSGEARAIAFHNNAVLVIGRAAGGGKKPEASAWTVQRWVRGNASWETVDVYRESTSHPSGAEAIAVDSSGRIFVGGYSRNVVKGKSVTYWVVRRSDNGGNRWETDWKQAMPDTSDSQPTGLASDDFGNVWLCGYGGSPMTWVVRHRAGVGAWPVSLSWSEGNGARPNGITCDAEGRVHVSGRWIDSGDGENWWVTHRLSAE